MEMPFELVVSVIVMSMILLIGYQMISGSLQEWKYSMWKKIDSEIIGAIREIANKTSGNSRVIYIKYDGCDTCGHNLFIEKVNNEKKCLRYCGIATKSCYLFYHYAYDKRDDKNIWGSIRCIPNVSTSIDILRYGESDCQFSDLSGRKRYKVNVWKVSGAVYVKIE